MLLNITVAQPLAYEYAALFGGLDDDDLIALADSFAFANCDIRTTLLEQLSDGLVVGFVISSGLRRPVRGAVSVRELRVGR